MIVVRSVVSGGAAAADGRLAPGDRLMTVNGVDVSRSPLATAVAAIKCADKGDLLLLIFNLDIIYANGEPLSIYDSRLPYNSQMCHFLAKHLNP